MGKNKNQYSALNLEDENILDDEVNSDESNSEESSCSDSGEELEFKIIEYHRFLKEQMNLLEKDIQSNSNLSKNTIKLFLSILDYCYDLIQEIMNLMKREDIKDVSQKIYDLDQKLNPIYNSMDKYRNTICSEEGMKRMNRLDFLNEVDIYYNLFISTLCPKYILTALEFSSWETLSIVDCVYYKSGKRNEKKRFETYLSILHIKQKMIPELLSNGDYKRLDHICGKNQEMKNEYAKLFQDRF
jgi:hypothetical protein